MAGCVEGPEDDVCLRWTWVKVIVLVCCYGFMVHGAQSPAKVVTGGNLTARAGDSVVFHCEVRNDSKIAMVEWTRCDRGAVPRKILVFMTNGSQLSLNDTYQGRVTMTTASSFTLGNVSMEDFGLYCCKLNVFPDGVLQAEVHLSEKADQAASHMLLGVVCAVVLVVVVTTVVVCKKCRVQLWDYSNVSGHQGSVPKGLDDAGEENDKGTEENIKGVEENIKGSEENIKSSVENLKSSVENLKGAEENLKGAEENIKGSEENIKGAEENIKGLEENIKSAEENIKSAEENIKSVQENIKGAEENIKSAEENIKVAEENIKSAEENIKGSEENIKVAEENIKSVQENIKGSVENIKSVQESDQLQHPAPDHVEGLSHLSGPEEAEMTTQQHAT